jgi:CubicO group peptidase (beta-lactamase class C family)
MRRRLFLQCGAATILGSRLMAAVRAARFDDAAAVLAEAVTLGQVRAAVLHVEHRESRDTRHFGDARSPDAMFLLGSITKPIAVAALMTLYDKGEFALDDPLSRFMADFTGDGRDKVTLRHLLTHTAGLPDQLPDNNELRAAHAQLSEFVAHAARLTPEFEPGSQYQYSSMGILLASHVAEVISGTTINDFVSRELLQPLEMNHSALGLGEFQLEDMISCQTEFGAPESGAGDAAARDWDWNSPYWRHLGAPWGGGHASAADIGRFLREFLDQRGTVLRPESARLMITNHNSPGLTPRGLGFSVGKSAGSLGCSDQTFGHTGSTGTIAWADPQAETICVVLTSLPGRAISPHPRELAADRVAADVGN